MGSVCLLRGIQVIKQLFQPQPNLDYPLMRDPQRSPKCYEMTEEERLKAVTQVAKLLEQRRRDEVNNTYYGA
jgi:hypothetical protein